MISGESLFGSTTIVGAGYAAFRVCDSTIVNGKINKDGVKGYGKTTIATGVTTSLATAYNAGENSQKVTASAYIESLNDQQLASLVEMLDAKEKTMSNVANTEVSKQMIKKL